MGMRHHLLVHWAGLRLLILTDGCVLEAHLGYCLHPLLMVEGLLKALEMALQSE